MADEIDLNAAERDAADAAWEEIRAENARRKAARAARAGTPAATKSENPRPKPKPETAGD